MVTEHNRTLLPAVISAAQRTACRICVYRGENCDISYGNRAQTPTKQIVVLTAEERPRVVWVVRNASMPRDLASLRETSHVKFKGAY